MWISFVLTLWFFLIKFLQLMEMVNNGSILPIINSLIGWLFNFIVKLDDGTLPRNIKGKLQKNKKQITILHWEILPHFHCPLKLLNWHPKLREFYQYTSCRVNSMLNSNNTSNFVITHGWECWVVCVAHTCIHFCLILTFNIDGGCQKLMIW